MNEIGPPAATGLRLKLMEQLKDPLLAMLLFAIFANVCLAQLDDAAIILVSLLLTVAIGASFMHMAHGVRLLEH